MMHLTVAKKKKVHVEFTVLFFGNSEWYQSVFSVAKVFNLLTFYLFPLICFCAIIFFLVLKFFEKKDF